VAAHPRGWRALPAERSPSDRAAADRLAMLARKIRRGDPDLLHDAMNRVPF